MSKEKKGSVACIIAAIIGIVIMETVAICHGIDGVLLTFSVAAVSGLGGYAIRPLIKRD